MPLGWLATIWYRDQGLREVQVENLPKGISSSVDKLYVIVSLQFVYFLIKI